MSELNGSEKAAIAEPMMIDESDFELVHQNMIKMRKEHPDSWDFVIMESFARQLWRLETGLAMHTKEVRERQDTFLKRQEDLETKIQEKIIESESVHGALESRISVVEEKVDTMGNAFATIHTDIGSLHNEVTSGFSRLEPLYHERESVRKFGGLVLKDALKGAVLAGGAALAAWGWTVLHNGITHVQTMIQHHH